MRDQSEFLKGLRLATDHLFAHRKRLRKMAVRIGFWPEGLVISTHVRSADEDEDGAPPVSLAQRIARAEASRIETIPWDRLESMDPAALIEIIDRACQPAQEVLGLRGAA